MKTFYGYLDILSDTPQRGDRVLNEDGDVIGAVRCAATFNVKGSTHASLSTIVIDTVNGESYGGRIGIANLDDAILFRQRVRRPHLVDPRLLARMGLKTHPPVMEIAA